MEIFSIGASMTEQAIWSDEMISLARQIGARNHAAFQVYQQWLGEPVSPDWNDMSDEWRKHNVNAVLDVLGGRLAIEQIGSQHQKWFDSLTAQGYVRGKVKDHELKTHPSLIPFEKLSKTEQIKDFLFLSLSKLQHDAYFDGRRAAVYERLSDSPSIGGDTRRPADEKA